ncbi:hypothetical protein BS47DRAFT_1369037 [Hydnum rufescens UP504]|uniref:Uncharacterized protein n=1 Tax=Hydnum rufescens UP504 TaxID=1448309 RepID=A0A9P6ADZ6_9AGAM|nr:hypothetical protein BS47DRAFT_1369037 [Hydnum rufescens UP504]
MPKEQLVLLFWRHDSPALGSCVAFWWVLVQAGVWCLLFSGIIIVGSGGCWCRVHAVGVWCLLFSSIIVIGSGGCWWGIHVGYQGSQEFGPHVQIHAKGIGNLIDIDTYKDELGLEDSLINISGEEEVATASLAKNIQTRLVDRKVVIGYRRNGLGKPQTQRHCTFSLHETPPKATTDEARGKVWTYPAT